MDHEARAPIPKAGKVAGHAYRPAKNPMGRGFIPGCECGAHLLAWAINGETARNIHNSHKKQILKAQKAEQ